MMDEFKKPGGRSLGDLRVWLVHDWLTGMRGGEKVLLELVRMFPQARIATLFCVAGSVDGELERRVARTSFLQGVPGIGRHYRNLLPVMGRAMRSIRLEEADLVISSSHCVAKAVGVGAGAVHLCYCHTPMRYIWGMEEHYFSGRGFSMKRMAARMWGPALRRADLASNETVTGFVANSRNVAERIERFYHRRAEVVHPGFDERFFVPGAKEREDYYLIVSALVPYKRVDIAIEAFMRGDRGRRLVVIGRGPEEGRLRALAGGCERITFMGHQSDEVLREHYQRCAALLFPGEEDFGMVPLEAQGCGAAVIAYGVGGVLETVVPWGGAERPTGVFFDEQSAAAMDAAMDVFEKNREAFVGEAICEHALGFRWSRFREGIGRCVREILGEGGGL